jgi:hypothetical protein
VAKNKNQNRQQQERQDQQRADQAGRQDGASAPMSDEAASPSPQDIARNKQKQRFGHN